MIEQWFGVLTRRLVRCSDFASREDLEAQITELAVRAHQPAARADPNQ